MKQFYKYFPYAILSVIAMYAVMTLEVLYINREIPDVWDKMLESLSLLGLAMGFGMYLVIFLASLAILKLSGKVLTSPFAQLMLAGLAYSALGAALFMQGSHMALQYYFPENWAADFQFFAIAYAFIRIADVRSRKSENA